MKLRQLRYLCEIVDQDLNVSVASKALHTSQPGISKQIRLLEDELGVEILIRRSNRIIGLTKQGQAVVEIARRMLWDANNIRMVGKDGEADNAGPVVVATTNVHAHYVLLPVLKKFRARFPSASIRIRQCSHEQIMQLVLTGEADLGVSTLPPKQPAEVATLPFFSIRRLVIAPAGHPLLGKRRITLRDLATYPMINVDAGQPAGASVLEAFRAKGIAPNIVLSATDADLIKAYVASGMGIATLPALAFDPAQDKRIRAVPADHLFPPLTSYISIHRHSHLRAATAEFIAMLPGGWTRVSIEKALRSNSPMGKTRMSQIPEGSAPAARGPG